MLHSSTTLPMQRKKNVIVSTRNYIFLPLNREDTRITYFIKLSVGVSGVPLEFGMCSQVAPRVCLRKDDRILVGVDPSSLDKLYT